MVKLWLRADNPIPWGDFCFWSFIKPFHWRVEVTTEDFIGQLADMTRQHWKTFDVFLPSSLRVLLWCFLCYKKLNLLIFNLLFFLFQTIYFVALQKKVMEKVPRMIKVWTIIVVLFNIYSVKMLRVFYFSEVVSSSTRNLWVSGLSSNTKAADLKNLFGKYGKVNIFLCTINKM